MKVAKGLLFNYNGENENDNITTLAIIDRKPLPTVAGVVIGLV